MPDLCLDNIISSASKLVTDFDTSQSTIYKKISDTLLQKSQTLPPLRVAINSNGDFYDYSDCFLQFILELEPIYMQFDAKTYTDDKSRIEVVPHLQSFGKAISEKYPFLLEIVMLYIQGDFQVIGEYIVKLNSLWSQNEKLSKNLQMITDQIDNVKQFGTSTKAIDINQTFTSKQLEIYTRVHLEITENHIKTVLNNIRIEINTAELHANRLSLDFLADIIEKISTKLPEEKEIESRLIEIERYKRMRDADFITNVEMSGCDSWSIWWSQKHIEPSIAIYLMKNREVVKNFIELSREPLDILQGEMLLGLISASNKNCTLKIIEIPQLIEWKLKFNGICEEVVNNIVK